MNTLKNNYLWIFSVAGLILFLVFSFIPTMSGGDPEAVKHKIGRQEAETIAVHFIQEAISKGQQLEPFAMYAAERDAFGYFTKSGVIGTVTDRYRETLPLEAYRVEVKETGSGIAHLVDINPYTGKPAEWKVQRKADAEPISATELERLGREAIARAGMNQLPWKLDSIEKAEGKLVYETSGSVFADAFASLVIRADASGVRQFTVQWNVPVQYMKLVKEQEAKANAWGTAGLLLSVSMQFAAIIYALLRINAVNWKRGVLMASLYGVFYCAFNLNLYPGVKASLLGILEGGHYNDSFSGGGITAGMISVMITLHAMTLFLAFGLYFSAVAGDLLARRQGWTIWPEGNKPYYSKHLATAVWKGYLLAPVMLGLQSVMYLIAENGLRTWYTIDPLTSPNNMVYPMLLPLLAWCAAVSEETVFRLLAIPVLKKLFRFTLPAVVLSSMIWALGHVQYPIYPYYTRFVEVTIIGLLFAYVFLKHGFLTAVYTHALVDIVWMGLAVTANNPSPAHWGAFTFYLAVPGMIGFIASRLRSPGQGFR